MAGRILVHFPRYSDRLTSEYLARNQGYNGDFVTPWYRSWIKRHYLQNDFRATNIVYYEKTRNKISWSFYYLKTNTSN
ncbi:protein of unknown function [Bacillus velezensis]|nr:protein of unknown function [Bacillus velezensis]